MLKKIILCAAVMLIACNAVYGAPAEIPKTGQSTSSGAGSVDDGALQRGVAWPVPRFAPANSGTVVTDNLTGLMWAGDGGTLTVATLCTGGTKTWQEALDYVACLNTNNYLSHSDWRLPNVNELESLVHSEYTKEATCGGPCATNAAWLNSQGFSNVQPEYYWSSTTYAGNTNYAWMVDMDDSGCYGDPKSTIGYVWPVRSGL